MRSRGNSGHRNIKLLDSKNFISILYSLVRKRSWFRSPSWAPFFQALTPKNIISSVEKTVKSSLRELKVLGANSGQSYSLGSLNVIRDFRALKHARLPSLSQTNIEKTTTVGGPSSGGRGNGTS